MVNLAPNATPLNIFEGLGARNLKPPEINKQTNQLNNGILLCTEMILK